MKSEKLFQSKDLNFVLISSWRSFSEAYSVTQEVKAQKYRSLDPRILLMAFQSATNILEMTRN
jgi:hypothetical protein